MDPSAPIPLVKGRPQCQLLVYARAWAEPTHISATVPRAEAKLRDMLPIAAEQITSKLGGFKPQRNYVSFCGSGIRSSWVILAQGHLWGGSQTSAGVQRLQVTQGWRTCFRGGPPPWLTTVLRPSPAVGSRLYLLITRASPEGSLGVITAAVLHLRGARDRGLRTPASQYGG